MRVANLMASLDGRDAIAAGPPEWVSCVAFTSSILASLVDEQDVVRSICSVQADLASLEPFERIRSIEQSNEELRTRIAGFPTEEQLNEEITSLEAACASLDGPLAAKQAEESALLSAVAALEAATQDLSDSFSRIRDPLGDVLWGKKHVRTEWNRGLRPQTVA